MKILLKILKNLISLLMFRLVDFVRIYSSNRAYIKGRKERVIVGKRVSLVNTLINVSSGDVIIGDDTIFGHNCALVTGVHEFEAGVRKKLFYRKKFQTEIKETPSEGLDITIGSGCWIATNVTVIGGVNIGNNVIVAAGSVVVNDIPSSVMVAGVPAKVIKKLSNTDD